MIWGNTGKWEKLQLVHYTKNKTETITFLQK